MKFTIALTTVFSALALAAPVEERQVPYAPCGGLYGNAQCCATDVLGVANLDCGQPPSVPTSAENFSAVCSAIGQRARCCALPVLDQGVLCNAPTGVEP